MDRQTEANSFSRFIMKLAKTSFWHSVTFEDDKGGGHMQIKGWDYTAGSSHDCMWLGTPGPHLHACSPSESFLFLCMSEFMLCTFKRWRQTPTFYGTLSTREWLLFLRIAGKQKLFASKFQSLRQLGRNEPMTLSSSKSNLGVKIHFSSFLYSN